MSGSAVVIHPDREHDDAPLPSRVQEVKSAIMIELTAIQPQQQSANATAAALSGESGGEPLQVVVKDTTADAAARYLTHPRVMMGWSNLSISDPTSLKTLVTNCSGYVLRGGVLAVLGPSPSGKTVLLKTLAGRLPNLLVDGHVTQKGHPIDVTQTHKNVAFVPAEDILIGELTVRETFTTAALLATNDPLEVVAKNVQAMIDALGLQAVQDNVVGTVLRRGLSGGEKRRVSVGVGLLASPSVIFLDEPTSGLDSTAAYQVIRAIRELARKSNGNLSVVLTIHQPNSRILNLFDHLLVLPSEAAAASSRCVFGTVPQVLAQFPEWGMPIPEENPELILKPLETSLLRSSDQEHIVMANESTYWRQFTTLFQRNVRIATRDITLYYLQFVMMSFYGFVIGAFFFDLPRRVDSRIADISNAIVWLALPASYINVFKVYHLMTSKERYLHERANNSYAVAPYWFAEFLVAAVASFLAFIPGLLISYGMMGLPSESIPFAILILYFCVLVAEAVCQATTQFTKNSSYAMVAAQGIFVCLCVFAGGSFIRWEYIPQGWVWLSEISFYTPITRSLMIDVFARLTYQCDASLVSATTCSLSSQGLSMPCVAVNVDGSCEVAGSTVLLERLGVSSGDDKWFDFGVVVILLVVTKLCIYVLHWYPWEEIVSAFHKAKGGAVVQAIVRNNIRLNYLATRLGLLKSEDASESFDHESARLKTSVAPSSTDSTAPVASLGANYISEAAALTAALTAQRVKKVVWKDLTLTLPDSGQVLVDHLKGYATAGRVLAIMGPSGAGKTTMLNALTGRAPYAKVTGQVLYCDRALTVKDLSFVPQFDTLNDRLTVIDTLRRMAELQQVYPSQLAMERHVSKLLNILNLETKANVLVGSLTTGERKRVSIGVGIIASPNVLCLDEPTTGLDGDAAYAIVTYIRRVARELNIVVLMTIHQPSGVVFDQLDDLLLMCRTPTVAGQCAYFGPRSAAKEYFGSLGYQCPTCLNLSDFYLDLVSRSPAKAATALCQGLRALDGDTGAEQCTLVAAQEDNAANDADLVQVTGMRAPKWSLSGEERQVCVTKLTSLATGKETWGSLYQAHDLCSAVLQPAALRAVPEGTKGGRTEPGPFQKYLTLVRQRLEYYLLEPGVYTVRAIELIVIGLFVGSMYFNRQPMTQNIPELAGAAFFITWSTLFSVVAAVPVWVRDRPGFQSDVLNGAYTLNQYAASLFTSSIPYTLLTAIAFQALVHWMVDFNPTAEAFIFNILMTTNVLLLMEGITLCIVEALRNFSAMLSTTMSMIVLGMMFLCPGFFIKTPDMPASVRWLSYIIPTRYVLRGQLISVFDGQSYASPGGPISGADILSANFNVDADEVSMWVWWFVVFVYVVGFRVFHRVIMTFTFKPLLTSSFPTPSQDDFAEAASGSSPSAESVAEKAAGVSNPDDDRSLVRIRVLASSN